MDDVPRTNLVRYGLCYQDPLVGATRGATR